MEGHNFEKKEAEVPSYTEHKPLLFLFFPHPSNLCQTILCYANFAEKDKEK